VPIVIANSFLNLSFSLVTLAGLSFLGLGAAPGSSDWGRMLSENEPLLEGNPAAVIAPALMIVLVAASMNLLGDWLAERVASRGRGQ
jgi:peptide/nickel transport system permease protein